MRSEYAHVATAASAVAPGQSPAAQSELLVAIRGVHSISVALLRFAPAYNCGNAHPSAHWSGGLFARRTGHGAHAAAYRPGCRAEKRAHVATGQPRKINQGVQGRSGWRPDWPENQAG